MSVIGPASNEPSEVEHKSGGNEWQKAIIEETREVLGHERTGSDQEW